MHKIKLHFQNNDLPEHIRLLSEHCREISQKICARSSVEGRIPQFQAADAYIAWNLLNSVRRQCHLPDNAIFCEWGSGIGQVTLMASELSMQSTGIEIEDELVETAKSIAQKFSIPARFITASMFPLENPTPPMNYRDVDLFFVYPWPAQINEVKQLFAQTGSSKSLLILYEGGLKYQVFTLPEPQNQEQGISLSH